MIYPQKLNSKKSNLILKLGVVLSVIVAKIFLFIKKYRITISIRKLSCNFVDFPIACNKYKYNEDEEFFQDFRSRFAGVFRGNGADVVRAIFDYRRDCRLLRTAAGVCSFGCRPRGGFSFRNS